MSTTLHHMPGTESEGISVGGLVRLSFCPAAGLGKTVTEAELLIVVVSVEDAVSVTVSTSTVVVARELS